MSCGFASWLTIIFLLLKIFFSFAVTASNRRIHFGEKVTTIQPFMASLLVDLGVNSTWFGFLQEFLEKNKFYRHKCGGLIYTEFYVVTAAHCITMADLHYVGVYGLSYHHMGEYHKIAEQIVHPDYVGEADNYDHDIGLVKTETKFQKFGVLPPYDPSLGDIENNPIILYGWGTTETGLISEDLQQLSLKFEPTDCSDRKATQEGREFCYVSKNSNSRGDFGDSGSPIVLKAVKPHEKDTVLSVISTVHVGVNFAYFVPWINSTIDEK